MWSVKILWHSVSMSIWTHSTAECMLKLRGWGKVHIQRQHEEQSSAPGFSTPAPLERLYSEYVSVWELVWNHTHPPAVQNLRVILHIHYPPLAFPHVQTAKITMFWTFNNNQDDRVLKYLFVLAFGKQLLFYYMHLNSVNIKLILNNFSPTLML